MTERFGFISGRDLETAPAVPVLKALEINAAMLSKQAGAPRECLNVGTLHSSKGLQFRAVAIVGCNDGDMPLRYALNAEQGDEAKAIVLRREQRLLYVGCSRAREALLLTHVGRPSRFLL